MKQDNNSGRKRISLPTWILIVAGGLLTVLLLVGAVARPKPEQPELLSITQIAAGIADGAITEIEDTLVGGELIIRYADGTTEKGMRDPQTSLLEQLNLLGLTQEQLTRVKIGVAPRTAIQGMNPVGIIFSLGFIGMAVYAITRVTSTERVSKKKFQQTSIPSLRFSHVAGLDDNLQELRDIVTFLKEGNKYADMGAHMPRGVLMVGDPGTGKTLIAKAVAGEAGVPFFATSGSEFTEVYVGVGASRMRSLFQKARKRAPCIIFIDEIDAVGRARHRSESGAEMEQDQTLNQLLVEMDGFDSSEGIVVLAATNRIDVLDPALTRPGRFDRRVFINRPDVKGREAILQIHTRGKKLAESVQLANVAKSTPGLVGADLANIVNEAAITAVRNDHPEIQMADFDEAVEKHIAGGVPRKGQVMSEDERRIVAYHEAGHALVIHETELSDLVYKISIIPRGQTGGYTMALPEHDRTLISRCKFLARITGLMGGRAAEEIFFQDITSGASNDLMVSTQLAEEMVMRLGMDPRTGLRVFPQMHAQAALLGIQGSQKTFETIDETVSAILDDCYAQAKRIILEKRDTLERIANELLEVETMDRDRFLGLMEERAKRN